MTPFQNYCPNTYESLYKSHRRSQYRLKKFQVDPYGNYDVTAKKKRNLTNRASFQSYCPNTYESVYVIHV